MAHPQSSTVIQGRILTIHQRIRPTLYRCGTAVCFGTSRRLERRPVSLDRAAWRCRPLEIVGALCVSTGDDGLGDDTDGRPRHQFQVRVLACTYNARVEAGIDTTESNDNLLGDDSVLEQPLPCTICQHTTPKIRFHPCGHTACRGCSRSMQRRRQKCHVCRQPINDMYSLYL